MMAKGMILFILLVCFGTSFEAQRKPEILKQKTHIFKNKDCEKKNSCDLKKVGYVVDSYRIVLNQDINDSSSSKYNYGTRLFAWYETDTFKNLENYVFVQFINGGMYYTTQENGQIVKRLGVSRYFFNDIVTFFSDKPTIDSIDKDPAYNSVDGLKRHDSYRWNLNPNSFDPKTEKFYKNGPPTNKPRLYVSDRVSPTHALETDNIKNIDLDFKTCIYKTTDVPPETTPNNLNFAQPIHCFEWKSHWIYNYKKSRFERPN